LKKDAKKETKESDEERKKRIRKELETYVEVIRALDSYRAFRRLDPRLVERTITKSGSEELRKVYHSIEGDMKRMAYYPAKVKEFRGMYRTMTAMKLLAAIASVFVVGIGIATLERSSVVSEALGNPVFVAVAVLLPIAAFNLSVLSEFRLRKKLAKTYEGKFSAERARIGAAVQSLIRILNDKVREYGEDPKKYKLSLFHDDYRL
jgi:hypothetical protein